MTLLQSIKYYLNFFLFSNLILFDRMKEECMFYAYVQYYSITLLPRLYTFIYLYI